MRKREFIYTIFITTISIFTVRRIFYFAIFKDCNDKVLEYNKVLTFIAYLILLVGYILKSLEELKKALD